MICPPKAHWTNGTLRSPCGAWPAKDALIRTFDERRDEHLGPKLRSRWVAGCPIAAGHHGLRAALDRMQDPLCIGGRGRGLVGLRAAVRDPVLLVLLGHLAVGS